MAVAAPPKPPARKKKSGALPSGMEQFSLEELFAAIPELQELEEPPVPAIKTQPVYRQPGNPRQLGFDSLEELLSGDVSAVPREIRAGGAGSGWGGVSRSASPGRRKTRKKTALPEGVYQSSLDELFATTSPLAFTAPITEMQPVYEQPEQDQRLHSGSLKQLPTGEFSRPAPRRRSKAKKQTGLPPGMEQSTLFAIGSGEAEEPITPTPPTLETRSAYELSGQTQQHDSDALAELPPENGSAIPEGEPAGSGTGSDGAAVRRSAVQTDGGAEDGLQDGLGDSDRHNSCCRREESSSTSQNQN